MPESEITSLMRCCALTEFSSGSRFGIQYKLHGCLYCNNRSERCNPRLLYPINFEIVSVGAWVGYICMKSQSLQVLKLLNVVTSHFIGLQRWDRLIVNIT